MFYILFFLFVWGIWLILADRARWRELFPVSILAAACGSIVDTVATHYGLWHYNGHLVYATRVLDNLGIYVVTPYLFIQYFPKKKTAGRITFYWLVWLLIAGLIEWIHLAAGLMIHGEDWNMPISLIMDGALLALFYGYYRLFQLERLAVRNG